MARQFSSLLLAAACAAAVAAFGDMPGAKDLRPEWSARLESLVGGALPAKPSGKRLLVFCRAEGFRHSQSIAAGNEAIRLAGEKAGAWSVDISEDYASLLPENLGKYDAVVLNNTTNLKTDRHRHVAPALVEFVKSGKGLAVVHSGDDGFSEAPDILYMIGGRFCGHPWHAGGTWRFRVEDADSPLTKTFPKEGFPFSDEIYMQAAPYYSRQAQHILVSLDLSDGRTAEALEKSRDRRRPDGDYAVAWVRRFGKGRVFYTSFGHDQRAWLDAMTLAHIFGGIQYALGDLGAGDGPSAPQFVDPPKAAESQTSRDGGR